jgi:lipopolysaccharide export system permease protein
LFSVTGRYINREVFLSWLGVTGVLLVIIMSHRFARYLGAAAAGEIPEQALAGLLGLSTIQYLVILIPIGFFLAVMLGLGRLYRDSEMAALMACGVGPGDLYRILAWTALPICLLAGWLSLFASPWAADQAHTLQREAESEAEFAIFESGGFHRLGRAEGVFYAERRRDAYLEEIFIQGYEAGDQVVIRAKRGRIERDTAGGARVLVLEDGWRWEFRPGSLEGQRTRFREHGIEITPPAPDFVTHRRDLRPTMELIASDTLADKAELHWRLALPVGGLVLAFLAVPLARTSPRQGRYGRLFVAILVYLVYSNLLGAGQVWLERGQVPVAIGLWWVHGLFVLLTIGMLLHQGGMFHRLRHRRPEVPA